MPDIGPRTLGGTRPSTDQNAPDDDGRGGGDAWQLARLLDGYLTTQLLYVAARLGVADVLTDGPLSGADIAAAVGADPASLTRVLRGLAAEDVLAETDDGRFELTLRRCVPRRSARRSPRPR